MNALIKTNVASNVLWEPEILYGDKIFKKKKKLPFGTTTLKMQHNIFTTTVVSHSIQLCVQVFHRIFTVLKRTHMATLLGFKVQFSTQTETGLHRVGYFCTCLHTNPRIPSPRDER